MQAAHLPNCSVNKDKLIQMQREYGAVGFVCGNQLTPIFSNLGPHTKLLLLLLLLKAVFNPSVTNTCKFKILYWMHDNLAANVHNSPHSSGPPERGWVTTCAQIHGNTSNPLLYGIQWATYLHGNSPLLVYVLWATSHTRQRAVPMKL